MSSAAPPSPAIHPYVEKRADVHGGRVVISGTRFPVSSIVQNHRRGLAVEELLRQFPELTAAKVYDALSYDHDHLAEINAEIEAARDIENAMRQFPPTLTPTSHGS